jgi:peptidoglycan/LPS O-acetylase OafA/YrhL
VLLVALVGAGIAGQIVLTVALPGNIEQWATYIAPPAGLVAFLSGHLLARAMRDGAIPRVPIPVAIGVPAACLAGGAWLISHKVAHGSSPFFFMGGVSMLAVPGWLVLVAALARADQAGRSPVGGTPLVRLGEWSYALYLLHPVVLHFAGLAGYFHLDAPAVVLAIGAWAAAVALSGLAYMLVERPLEDWLRGGRPGRPLPGDEAAHSRGEASLTELPAAGVAGS